MVLTATPGGTHLWVHAPDPQSDELACEGAPFEYLWALDATTGERRRALDVPDDQHPLVGKVEVSPVDPGRVLLVGQCEGYLTGVHLATTTPDGILTDLVEVPLPELELRSHTVRWMGGDQLMAVANTAEGQGELLVHQLDGDGWDDLGRGDWVDWLPLGDGLAAEVLFQQIAIVGEDGEVLDSVLADTVVRAPDGGFPLLATRYETDDDLGALLLVRPGGVQEQLGDRMGLAPTFSPDGSHVAWSEIPTPADGSDVDGSIVSRLWSLAHGSEVVLTDTWFSGVHWLDGSVAYTAEGPTGPEGYPTPVVRVRDFTPAG